jgi:hypothetical protein
MVIRVIKESKDLPARRVILGRRVRMEQPVRKAIRVLPALKARRAIKA